MQNSLVNNTGVHLHRAIGSTTCGKHKADIGMPCWVLPNNNDHDKFHYAICGKRIAKAGFNGKITSSSMRPSNNTKRKDGARTPFNKNPRSNVPSSK